MNNKGFAITSIIYGLMLLFVVIITSFLSILVGRNRRMDEVVEGVYESLKYEEITITKDSFIENDNTSYGTPKRALYHFDIDNDGTNECSSYLPKNTALILGTTRGDGALENDIYYYYAKNAEDKSGADVKNYEKITCIN